MQFVTDYLDITAKKFQGKIAFTDGERELNFLELQNEAKSLGTVIAKKEYFQKPVCIFMDKNVESIVSMLGIVYSGNFYSVIDTGMPESRLLKILEVLKPVTIVTTKSHEDKVKELFAGEIVIYEDAVKEGYDQKLLELSKNRLDGESLIFILFTSGSTGIPKGVMIKHKAFPPYLKWYAETFSLSEETVFANQAPFYFIMSCPDIYLTIMCGATCHIVPKKYFSFPMNTLTFLNEHRVNTIYWVPSVLSMIANFRALPELHIDTLKLVLFGGEVMPSKQLNMWRREYPDVTFVNLYGPTETTEMISYYIINREISDTESLPIGVPTNYIRVMLLDENGREVAKGMTGELCCAGVSIAGGYYNMPEKSAEVFVPNPLYKDGDDSELRIMYRTGDLAREDESGNLIFMGRADFQIKHMGNRIELGEIEAAASSLDGLDACCCLYDTKRQKIVMFYCGNIDEDALDISLKSLLPAYMVPNRIERLETLPVNLNGKIDRAALKEMI